MSGDIEQQKVARFNDAFATILQELGYKTAARFVRRSDESAYEQWKGTRLCERYFMSLPGTDVEWHHRKFLNETFKKGTAGVFKLAAMKPSKLEKLAKSYHLGSDEGVRVHKIHDLQYA